MTGVAGLCAIALAVSTAPAPVATATASEKPRTVELLSAAPTTRGAEAADGARTRPVRLDTAALRDVRAGDRVSLTLFDDTTVTVAVDGRTSVAGATSWTGALVGTMGTFSAAEVDGVAHLSVTSATDGVFEVSTTRGGGYEVAEVPPRTESVDDVVPAGRAERSGAGPQAESRTAPAPADAPVEAPVAADAASVIDLAIVYTASLPSSVGEDAMRAQFALGVAQVNQALAASGIGTQVRLVGTRQVAAPGSGDIFADYRSLRTPGDGAFDEAQALREETHADLVSLWLGGPAPSTGACGLGGLGGLQPQYDPEIAAFTAVWADQCATGTLTFAHEVGHNLSAQHDEGASSPPSDGKAYARGYVDAAGGFRTVMAYLTTCPDCVRVGHYSNPGVSFNGRVTGTPATLNALAISEQAPAVANYRQSQIYPGAVSIGGEARSGRTATATTTPWAPVVQLGYQWFLDGVAVPNATAPFYRLSRSDIGRTLSLQVTGSAPFYQAVAASSAPVVVGKALFRTSRPKLRGTPRAGRVLSVKVKGWKPKPSKKSVKVRYQWLKNGKKIKGAKKATYRLRAKDRGKKISVRVTTKKKGYEKATRTSKKVKVRR
ncbi:hypothetical protein GCM10011376_02090 [Nocardioides flavus (ex Wang et al. 2016)]|uniref:Metallo-peptidase family M12B Reprolysin-like n=2 Tax=Nocardioides flavus (ex Wang et al. 2016) TaxID=2058780 RepID=A0ABQ3HHR2_9ACTN|nr:hypothetical protein GCM10011376_02090 [Nocardioides flavus (ex Wang et al. 2016)]